MNNITEIKFPPRTHPINSAIDRHHVREIAASDKLPNLGLEMLDSAVAFIKANPGVASVNMICKSHLAEPNYRGEKPGLWLIKIDDRGMWNVLWNFTTG